MTKRTKKILYIAPVLGHPAIGGSQLRVENSIKALNKVSELHVLSHVSKSNIGEDIGEKFYRSISWKFLYMPSVDISFSAKLLKILQNVSKRYLKIDISFIFFYRNVNFIVKYIDKNSIDIVWFGYGSISYNYIKRIKEKRPESKVVCDTDSVWSRFILREIPFIKGKDRIQKIKQKGREKEEEEKEGTKLADVTTAVSGFDAEYYRNLSENPQKIHIFSNAIDMEVYQKKPSPVNNLKEPFIYVAGTFWLHSPMEDGTRWLIKKVFPRVRQQISNIHLYIIGVKSDQILSDVKDVNITITGKVSSVLPYLCYADVAVVPLRFESGTRFKILEAAACGIPIVSTTLGAEGFDVVHKRDILIVDDEKAFADSIIDLIKNKDLAERISTNCKKLVQKRYTIKSLVKQAKSILVYLDSLKN